MPKPKMVSLFKTMVLERMTMDEATQLLGLPRTIGIDPTDNEPIVAQNGKYGPYLQKGKDYRTLENEDQLLTITIDQALAIYSLPKVYRRGRNPNSGPLREFGADPVSGRPVVAKDGKFGTYVTDGEINASLGRGDRVEDMLPERAFELLVLRREYMADKGITPKSKGTAKKAAAKKPATKKAPAKKPAAKKSPAKKAAAKRAAPRKTAAKKATASDAGPEVADVDEKATSAEP
jgi:DNA topoisomerase-1